MPQANPDAQAGHEAATRRPAIAWTQAQEQVLLERYRAGALLREIAAELGRETGSVGTHLELMRQRGSKGVAPRKPRWTETERQRLALRYRQGASRPQLCREFSRARGTIGRQLAWLRAHGYDLTREPITQQSEAVE